MMEDLGVRAIVRIFVFLHFLIPVLCQSDPRDQNAIVNTFYLTSNSDCSNELKNIYNYEAVVQGYDLNNLATGPTSCTIKITSQSVYPGVTLQILIVSMDIQDCRTQLAIYDGQGTTTLGSFDCRSPNLINRQNLMTSGDTVTFILNRDNPDNHQFDIEIRVKPVIGGIDPDTPGIGPGGGYNYFNFQKFEQEAIVGMIGGLYGLVIIICIAVVCYCNIRYRGLNKKWETHQLATMKTDTTFDGRSQMSQAPWSVPSQSHGPTSTYARSYATTTEPYSRKGPAYARSDGDESTSVYDHDEKFQQRNLMNGERDRVRGRDRDRGRMASNNNTYSDDDDEDDPDNFKEKVITPRVKTSGNRWQAKDQHNRNRGPPPSFEEATRRRGRRSDRSSEEDDDEETEEETEEESSSDNESTRKRLTTSSEGEDSDDYSETESESGSSDASSSRRGARARRPKNNKKNDNKSKSKARRRRQSSTDDASSQRTSEPRRNGNGKPSGNNGRHPPPQPAMPYGAYPAGGAFVPVMAGHPAPQFQALPMMPPNYPPPQYPMANQPPPPTSHGAGAVKPTEPPVYSYLVRRGYTPMDPSHPNSNTNNNRQNSPAGSVASSQRGPPPVREEPDTPLQSGVEYMRR